MRAESFSAIEQRFLQHRFKLEFSRHLQGMRHVIDQQDVALVLSRQQTKPFTPVHDFEIRRRSARGAAQGNTDLTAVPGFQAVMARPLRQKLEALGDGCG